MPLIKIPNQPLFSDPDNPTEEYCPGDYCHTVRTDDPMYVQWYQTPCGLNETCDEDFTDATLGSDLAISSCASGDLTLGTGWTCAAGITYTNTTPQSSNTTVRQANRGMTQYAQYQVEITIANRTTGGIRIVMGGGGTQTYSSWYDTNSSITTYITLQSDPASFDDFYIEATGTSYSPYQPTGGFDGDVTVVFKEITTGCWNNGSGTWAIDGTGGACKTETGTGALTDDAGGNYLTSGEYYVLEVVISNYVSGTLTPNISGATVDDISGNGTFKRYATATASTFITLTPSSDFIGCVDSVDIRALKNDYTLTVVDAETFAEIEDVSSYLTYYNEYVTFCMQPDNISLALGCYKLFLYDDCDVQYGQFVVNGEFNGSDPGPPPTVPNWNLLGGGNPTNQFSFPVNRFSCSYTIGGFGESAAPTFCNDPNLNFLDGNYRITFDIISNTDTTNIGCKVRIFDQDTAATTYTTVGTHTYDVAYTDNTADNLYTQRLIVEPIFDATGSLEVSGTIVIDNVSVTKLAPYSATYESECFKVVATAPKSKLFIGTSDKDIFGFEFANSGFKLVQRLECRSFAPGWTISKDSYTFSTGTKRLNYAEIEKIFEVFIEAVPQTVHGTIALQTNCDTFGIGDTESDYVEYVVEDGDYTPEWDRTGSSDLAPSRLNMRVKTEGMKFNRSC